MSQFTLNYGRCGLISNTSDLSGEVEVTADGWKTHIKIPAHMLLTFVADWLRMQKIRALEDAETAQLLGVNEFDLPRECRVPR